jgi:glycine hydroxymethyltransferase
LARKQKRRPNGARSGESAASALLRRDWVAACSEDYVQKIAAEVASKDADAIDQSILALIAENRKIHETDCVNLNPAANVMNPRAEAAMAAGLGSRPSLGYPGDKYEMGLEAVEKIEVIAAELAAETFGARFAEIRVGSGALANLYAFMATTKPGDRIIVPPADIAGHVTHHRAGAAGLFGLDIIEAPIDPRRYTVDVDVLRTLAGKTRPKLITIGGSLNLFPHPVREARTVADEVGAKLLFDAAHICGMIAGRLWPNPLDEGAHLMTMSAYKSLGGPPSGLILTNEPDLAERIEQIAYPGLTANFDVGKTAALAIALLDWKEFGRAYARAMRETAKALAKELGERDLELFAAEQGVTRSHQFALLAARWGGGQSAAKRLRRANILTSGIGLPIAPVAGDLNGLRIGTPEITRWGMGPEHMGELAELIARALIGNEPPEKIADEVRRFRWKFSTLRFIRPPAATLAKPRLARSAIAPRQPRQ